VPEGLKRAWCLRLGPPARTPVVPWWLAVLGFHFRAMMLGGRGRQLATTQAGGWRSWVLCPVPGRGGRWLAHVVTRAYMQRCLYCGAPADSEVIQASTDDNGIFVFVIRNESWSPYPEGQPIPFMEKTQ
jgi:hypothetical protein